MLRVGFVLFTLIFVVQGSTLSLKHGTLLERLKRSPYYCDPPAHPHPPPPPPRPYWPPPPPPPPLPRPYWPPQPPPPPPPPFWHHHHHHRHHEPSFQEGRGPSYQQYTNGPNEFTKQPCDNCNGKNSALSNAKSVTGDAIAISISRSNANR